MAPKAQKKIQIGTRQSVIVGGQAENPLHLVAPDEDQAKDNPRLIGVSYNARESPAAFWFHKKKSIELHHLQAANKFRKIWERAGGAGAGALDYTKERVDTSSRADPISDRVMDAGFQLKAIRNALTTEQYHIIGRTCGECQFLNQIYTKRGQRDEAMRRIKEGLTTLSEDWGFIARERGKIHPFHNRA